MIKIAQENEEGRVRMIVKTSMESPQIIVTDGDDLKVFFFTSSGFFMREYDKTTNTMHCNVRVIKLLFSSPGEYGPTSSPGNWSVLTSLCQIEILHLEASGMYWVRLQLHLFSLSCNDLFLDLNFACSSSRGLYFFQTSFFFFLKSIIWDLSFL